MIAFLTKGSRSEMSPFLPRVPPRFHSGSVFHTLCSKLFSFAIALDLERLFLHCHILRGSTIGKASERIRDEKSTFPRFASLALFPLERMSLASRSIRSTDPHLIESKLFLKEDQVSFTNYEIMKTGVFKLTIHTPD